jgi:cytochrome o ubiquinol oxidase subunit 3
MIRPITPHHLRYPDVNHDTYSRTVFGFWLYLLTDCVLFAVLFAAYAVLLSGTAGGVTAQQIIHLPIVLWQTLALLASSFTIALGMLQAIYNNLKKLIGWFALTFLLGILFLFLQWSDLSSLINEGNTWNKSAFLSAYFTLEITHALHIIFGLLFMIVFLAQALRRGLTDVVLTRLTCLRLFWLFLDLIWIVMFSYVYLLGVSP